MSCFQSRRTTELYPDQCGAFNLTGWRRGMGWGRRRRRGGGKGFNTVVFRRKMGEAERELVRAQGKVGREVEAARARARLVGFEEEVGRRGARCGRWRRG
jgi:hypothetical protein